MRTPLALAAVSVAVSALGAVASSARADDPCKPVKPCEVPEGMVAKAIEPPVELTAEVKALFDLVACRTPPAGLDAAAVNAYCGRSAQREERARAVRAQVLAGAPEPRPAQAPSVVVAPLSGDLLAARIAFPQARSLTLTGRGPAGDPRPSSLREAARLRGFLAAVDADLARAGPPAALPALLGALAAAGDEPVGLRYFRVEAGGSLHFLGAGELQAVPAGGEPAWSNCEIVFVRKGEPGRQLIVRYLRADLTDAGVEAAPGPLAYLEARGPFGAVLSDERVLAQPEYGRLRALLQRRAAVVVARQRG